MCYIYVMVADVQNRSMGDFRLRGIPEELHRRLKALAALAGRSINEYIIDLLKEHVAKQKGKL